MKPLLNLAAAALMLTTTALSAPAHAQATDYPTKPIKMVIAFPPGGPTDVNARQFAQAMSETLGQPVVVENRPGAGGNIASTAVMGAPNDGYTILYNTSSLVLGALLYHSAKHDPLKDFAPIARTVATPLVLAVHPSLPVKNVRDLVALAKKEPGKLNYASSGAGVIDHLATAMMATRLDIKIEHVPYKGTAPALTDLVGGNTQMFLTTINTVLPFVKDKRLTALAVSSRARSPLLPDVPTLTEATGLNDLELTAWNGLVAPAGTPPAIVAKLNAAVNSALAQPAFQEKMRAMGVEMYGGTPAEYAAFLVSETKRLGDAIQQAGVPKQ